ncbi:hypothetical protein V8J08_003983 [Citrobacter amalonaticus]
MSDKNDKNRNDERHSTALNREKINNDSVEYGERQGTNVTNTFSPPTRPDKGEHDGDKSDS